MNLVSSTLPYERIEISSNNLRINTKFAHQGYVINPWRNYCLLSVVFPLFMFSKKGDYHHTSNIKHRPFKIVASTWLCHIVKVGLLFDFI